MFLIRIIRVFRNEFSVARRIVVFLGHKDDAILALK